jgi:hypothetical protein
MTEQTMVEPAVGAVWSHPRAAAMAYGCAVADVHRDTAMRAPFEAAWLAAIMFPSGGSFGLGRYSPANDLDLEARERALADVHYRGVAAAARRGLKLVVLVPAVAQMIDGFGCYEWPQAWRVARVYRAPGMPVEEDEMVLAEGVSPVGGSLVDDPAVEETSGPEWDEWIDPETGLRDE